MDTPVEVDSKLQRFMQAYLQRKEASSAKEDKQAHPSEHTASVGPFWQQLNMMSASFIPIYESDMVSDSTAIVRGKIISVSDGRTLHYRNSATGPLHTLVMKVAVEDVLKEARPVGDHVYVEMFRSPIASPEALNAMIPQQQVILFLAEAYTNHEVYRYTEPSKEANGNGRLFELRTPQGLLTTEGSGPYFQPLAENEPIFDEPVASLEAIRAILRNHATLPARN